jgi:hypothetical protein
MANITEEHLHHMARRHHATMQKLDTIREKITGFSRHAFGTLEVGAGAWAGGLIEGRFNGWALGPLPANLLAGAVLLFAGHTKLAKDRLGDNSDHLINVGNGLLASYTAALGYNFGKNWREGKKLFGPSTPLNPYDDEVVMPSPPGAPGVPGAPAKTGWGY